MLFVRAGFIAPAKKPVALLDFAKVQLPPDNKGALYPLPT